MAEPASGPFKICCSRKNLEELKLLAARAASRGIEAEFLAQLRMIDQKLSSDPLAWGDPQYRLPSLGLLCCHGFTSLLHVYYAVEMGHKLVFVKEFLSLPNSALAD